jgi:hypothetical protein
MGRDRAARQGQHSAGRDGGKLCGAAVASARQRCVPKPDANGVALLLEVARQFKGDNNGKLLLTARLPFGARLEQ